MYTSALLLSKSVIFPPSASYTWAIPVCLLALQRQNANLLNSKSKLPLTQFNHCHHVDLCIVCCLQQAAWHICNEPVVATSMLWSWFDHFWRHHRRRKICRSYFDLQSGLICDRPFTTLGLSQSFNIEGSLSSREPVVTKFSVSTFLRGPSVYIKLWDYWKMS